MAKAEAPAKAGDAAKTQVNVAEFPEVGADASTGSTGQLDILLDMDVTVMVALGETQIPVRRLLKLGPGSVLELDKSVDATADLYLRGTKFAEGEVVVVDDRFGIRIKRILGINSEEVSAEA